MSKKNYDKILNIIKYTVEKSIRNKWFVVLNILLFAVTLVTLNLGTVKQIFKEKDISFSDKKLSIEVVDSKNLIYDKLSEKLLSEEFNKKIEIKKVDLLFYDEKTLEKEKLLVEVIESEENMIDLKIISKEGIESTYINIIQELANEKKNELYANKYNLDIKNIDKIIDDVNVERIMVGVDNKNSDIKVILQTIINYLILFMLMIVLSKIANDVSQEKVSKSIEYVLTTISAKAYLIAKVVSINLALIAQFVLGIVYFLISSSINSLLNMLIVNKNMELNTAGLNISTESILEVLDLNIILYIAIIFVFSILTVFILCLIQAALSARTTNISEASNATILLVVVNVILYMISTLVISPVKEASVIMYILSCIPVASMYFIPSMLLIGQANIIQVIISLVLLIVSIPFIFKICAKYFKEGVLDSGNKKKVKNIKQEKSIRQIQEEYLLKIDFSRYGFVIGVSVLLFIVLQLVLSVITLPLLSALSSVITISSSNINSISSIIVFIVSLLIPALFVIAYIPKKEKIKINDSNLENSVKNEKNKEKMDIKLWIKSIVVVVPIVMLVQILLGILLEKLGLNYDIIEKIDLYDSSSTLSKILFFVQIAILPAIFEELYIRKAVLNYSRKYGTTFAIISSSILFSLIHLNISQSLFAFIMGVILAIVAIRCKSIIPAGIIHFLNNGYAAIITIFENNLFIVSIVNILMLLLCFSGIVIMIIEIVKNRIVIKDSIMKMLKKEKIDGKEEVKLNNLDSIVLNESENIYIETKLSKGYKYILCDYSFIISTILVIVMLLLTQNMLSMM